MAAATGNVTNQAVQFQNNGAPSRQYFGNNNNENDGLLDPDEIAKTYLNFYMQNKSAWSWEIEIRPWVEKF